MFLLYDMTWELLKWGCLENLYLFHCSPSTLFLFLLFFLAFSQGSLYSHYFSRAYLRIAHIFPIDRDDGVP